MTYTYDDNGNRLCKGEQAPATTYSYVAGTNLLGASTGGEGASYSYDDNGNTIGDGSHTYEYNDASRLATVDTGAAAEYTYDGDGRRVIRMAGTTTYFFYDPSGQLLSEVTPDPKAGKDYIHVFGEPVGRVDWTTEQDLGGNVLRVGKNSPDVRLDWSLFPAAANDYVVRRKQVVDPNDKTFDGSTAIATVSDPTQIYDDPVLNEGNDYNYRVFRLAVEDTLYFYHADHIDMPVAMSDGAANLVWRVEIFPFGGTFEFPVEDVENNLRFPGQYQDVATPFYYNLNRWYEFATGRYTRPDPIGLAGGTNPYLYANANPIAVTDPTGTISVPAPENPGCALLLARGLSRATAALSWSDKYKHCLVSCVLADVCGPGSSGLAGLGKEIRDLFGVGNAEIADLIADATGIICAVFDTATCDCCCQKKGYIP